MLIRSSLSPPAPPWRPGCSTAGSSSGLMDRGKGSFELLFLALLSHSDVQTKCPASPQVLGRVFHLRDLVRPGGLRLYGSHLPGRVRSITEFWCSSVNPLLILSSTKHTLIFTAVGCLDVKKWSNRRAFFLLYLKKSIFNWEEITLVTTRGCFPNGKFLRILKIFLINKHF